MFYNQCSMFKTWPCRTTATLAASLAGGTAAQSRRRRTRWAAHCFHLHQQNKFNLLVLLLTSAFIARQRQSIWVEVQSGQWCSLGSGAARLRTKGMCRLGNAPSQKRHVPTWQYLGTLKRDWRIQPQTPTRLHACMTTRAVIHRCAHKNVQMHEWVQPEWNWEWPYSPRGILGYPCHYFVCLLLGCFLV